ncbi:RDD family protein [Protaetiibacter mangrovi]|uniref:RDD family protein n=1 Tax=Protaetiibacter mangrovi TaxID=2970926 RepID=A0ABT1ZFG3_9MICO|nr:RDD family protein [Protaetiibacter mangrovi]MCS0499446.1 RDD family protein [Protaetiibacter mangrovi]TPX02493.1 RDD family protein [Schumannella luteola]
MAADPDADWVDTLADDDALLTGEAVALDLRPAGFALRAGGAVIDFAASLVLFVVLIFAFFVPAGWAGLESAWAGVFTIGSLVIAFVIAPCLVETLTRGKSLGRLAVGARIVRDDGGAAGLRHAAIRALAGVVDFLLTLGGLAALVGILSPRSKRLGDHLAGTYAQYERAPRVATPIFGMPLELTAWAHVADVARMPDPLARRVANFLASARELDPTRRGYLAQQLAYEVSQYVSPLPAVEPELFLAGVTVARRDREARALALEAERLARLAPVLAPR